MKVHLTFIFCLIYSNFIKTVHLLNITSEGTNALLNTSIIPTSHRAFNTHTYSTGMNENEAINIQFLDNGCGDKYNCFNQNCDRVERVNNNENKHQLDSTENIDSDALHAPIVKPNETFIDYMIPGTGEKSDNVPKKIHLWPENITTGYYEVPIIYDTVSELTQQRLLYVFGYLSRGIKILFRDPLPTDEVIVKVTENYTENCWANLGRGEGSPILYINIPPVPCYSIHIVLHQVMHILGCVHAHERNSGNYTYFRQSHHVDVTTRTNVYDELSVMIYPTKVSRITTNNGYQNIQNIARGRLSFISRCDWNFILQLYPSGQLVPDCIPNHIPNVLIPTPALLEHLDLEAATHLCHYQNEFFFDVGYCETDRWNFYPLIAAEFAPILKNETNNLKSVCVVENVCNGFNYPNNVNEAEDRKISLRPLETQLALVYLERGFCQKFLHRFIIVLHKLPFYKACVHHCQETVRINTLINCFRRHYRLHQQTSFLTHQSTLKVRTL